MRTAFLLLGVFLFGSILTGAAYTENRQCQDGTFYLGDPLSASRIKLSGYCVDWDTERFTGLLPSGRKVERDLRDLEPLTDAGGRPIHLIRPPVSTSSDSLYEALKGKPLDQMSNREYEYFMLKKKAETEKGSETTTARAAMMQAETTRSMVNTYITFSVIGILLAIGTFFLIR